MLGTTDAENDFDPDFDFDTGLGKAVRGGGMGSAETRPA